LALRRDGRTVRRGPLEVRFRAFDSAQSGLATGGPRVAYAISRAVGGAVVRNRIRRRLRAIMIEVENQLEGIPKGDFLIRVFPGVAYCDYSALRQHLTAAIGEFSSEILR